VSLLGDAVLQKINELFSALEQSVFLLDRQGRCLVPHQPDTFLLPASLQENIPVSKSGYLFLTLPGYEVQTLVTKDKPEAHDLLTLCARLILAFKHEQGITTEFSNALKRLLLGELTQRELENLMHRDDLLRDIPRRVMLLSLPGAGRQVSYEELAEYVPQMDNDLFVPLGYDSLALVRALNEDEHKDLVEYAMALQDTLQNELGLQAIIGIGGIAPSLCDLARSYEQADQAIRVGSLFGLKSQIFDHENLVLERFMMDCAPRQAEPYIAELFNPATEKLFNEEMLDTVNVFISRDLNLTDAARDLYIHRNTLVYRLDKIQKVTGLDLRHFRDAMLFKLLNDLRKKHQNSSCNPS
jgi:carbohydrate diacid regulator